MVKSRTSPHAQIDSAVRNGYAYKIKSSTISPINFSRFYNPVIDWEYWNGTTWTDLTETDVDTGASVFTSSGKFVWTFPFGWAITSVNGVSAFWVRGTLTTGYTIDPICGTMTLHDSINRVVEPCCAHRCHRLRFGFRKWSNRSYCIRCRFQKGRG